MHKIGITILTNGERLEKLQTCITSLLENCHYRPLVIAIFDNGSTDGTAEWFKERQDKPGYAIEWRMDSSDTDLGCAAGTNRVSDMVQDCKYVLHLESDFRHLPQELTGIDGKWLHQVLDFMEAGTCQYLYLRRMVHSWDIAAHWWAQWFDKIGRIEGNYMECPTFWWSNNPHVRLNAAVYDEGCLPLDEALDGQKGTPGWSQPELKTKRPPNAWIHKSGFFAHDAPPDEELIKGVSCPVPGGCKYGFFNKGPAQDMFCRCCDTTSSFTDMAVHFERLGGG